MNHSFHLESLRKGLRPFRLHWFSRLRSTNDHAAALRRRREMYAPAIVLTGSQIAGRGRGGNTWWSGPGSLTVTFVLPIDDQIAPHQLPLIAGLAVREAAVELTGADDIQLKWPNDLLYHERKLAGLLCERIDRADLVGLGLNVNVAASDPPPSLRNAVTSLSQISGRPFDLTEVLLCVAGKLRQTLAYSRGHSFSALLRQYDRHHALLDRRVRVINGTKEPAIEGICRGLDSMGRLLVQDRKVTRRVIAGTVLLEKR
jgi:BirA family transcriptional regulator, biotin operon repressor / biotin---[acetyl-CoA-carboxylase] ligase